VRAAAAKPSAALAVDSVTDAERYIYGRGVAQDCDRGLRILKPAAESNVKAMISFGVLYSTGTCTPRDLPTAYRWFALALHKEPDNQALQEDLQKLWGQMTQPERQLAIKLSQ
jgi:TPR repeat protein